MLAEAGYRCAVPTCRSILAIDLHHIVELSEEGSDEAANLIPFCPTCHALYHRGTYTLEAVRFWKGVLVSLTHAFDQQAIDDLLFLSLGQTRQLFLSGDGVLRFARIISAGLAEFTLYAQAPMTLQFAYVVKLTPKGEAFVTAWKTGDRAALAEAQAFA